MNDILTMQQNILGSKRFAGAKVAGAAKRTKVETATAETTNTI